MKSHESAYWILRGSFFQYTHHSLLKGADEKDTGDDVPCYLPRFPNHDGGETLCPESICVYGYPAYIQSNNLMPKFHDGDEESSHDLVLSKMTAKVLWHIIYFSLVQK